MKVGSVVAAKRRLPVERCLVRLGYHHNIRVPMTLQNVKSDVFRIRRSVVAID